MVQIARSADEMHRQIVDRNPIFEKGKWGV